MLVCQLTHWPVCSVTVLDTGELVVGDTRLLLFSPAGQLVREWGGERGSGRYTGLAQAGPHTLAATWAGRCGSQTTQLSIFTQNPSLCKLYRCSFCHM